MLRAEMTSGLNTEAEDCDITLGEGGEDAMGVRRHMQEFSLSLVFFTYCF